MVTFDELIYRMFNVGVADVLIPFVLIFTLVFAIMQRTKVLGEDSKKYNIIVATVMGLALVFPHVLGTYPPQSDPVVIINNSLPTISLLILAILMVLLLLGAFGSKLNMPKKGGLTTTVFFGAIVAVGYIFLTNAGYFGNRGFPSWLNFLNDPDTQSLIVILLIFGVIIWFITRDSGDDADKKPSEPWITSADEK